MSKQFFHIVVDKRQFRNVINAFDRALARVESSALRSAVRVSATIALRAARNNARKVKKTGALADSLDVKVVTIQRPGDGKQIAAFVGPKKGYSRVVTVNGVRRVRIPSKYAHLVEYGSFNKRTGRRNQAKPFMRPAFESSKSAVQNRFADVIGPHIHREVDKHRAKNGGNV